MVSIDPIQIRMFQEQDISYFVREEMAQGWNSTEDKFHRRREDQQAGRCITLTAEYRGCPAGYLSVYWDSPWGPFGNAGYPEIVDLAVLEKYRNRGVGNRLMDEAEALAAQKGNFVYLGVGLHSGYGSAQRMYIKRGYLPDGSRYRTRRPCGSSQAKYRRGRRYCLCTCGQRNHTQAVLPR